jgi:hypothetical protein
LVRYIHLNPIRARLVKDIDELGWYPYSGHSVLMGKVKNLWQDTQGVLGMFGKKLGAARHGYRLFVEKGIAQGKRQDLAGGAFCEAQGVGKGLRLSGKRKCIRETMKGFWVTEISWAVCWDLPKRSWRSATRFDPEVLTWRESPPG